MKLKATIRKSVPEDLSRLKVRKTDKEELKALVGRYTKAIIRGTFKESKCMYTMLSPMGQVVAVAGLWIEEEGRVGQPWLIASEDFFAYARDFYEVSFEVIDEMLATTPIIHNLVWEKNTKSVNWLKSMGFEFHPDVQVRNGENFLHFLMRA